MKKFTTEAVQEWIDFTSKNAQTLKDLIKDEKDEVEVADCYPPPMPNPCCCPKIVKLFVFAWDVDIYTAACPELDD